MVMRYTINPPQFGAALGAGYDAGQRNRLAEAQNVRADNALALRERGQSLSERAQDFREMDSTRRFEFGVTKYEDAERRRAEAARLAAAARAAAERRGILDQNREAALALTETMFGTEGPMRSRTYSRLLSRLKGAGFDPQELGFDVTVPTDDDLRVAFAEISGEVAPRPEGPTWDTFEGPDGQEYYYDPNNPQAGAQPITGQSLPPQGMSSREEQIARSMRLYGWDEATAAAYADGFITTSRDPVTGELQIVDLRNRGTGESAPSIAGGVGASAPASGTPQPVDAETIMPEGADYESAIGPTGLGIRAANFITGVLGGEVAPETAEADRALAGLSTRTMLNLSAAFPGRPSNLTRERIERDLTIQPAQLFDYPARARGTVENTLAEIRRRIQVGENVLQRRLTPVERERTLQLLENLNALEADYAVVNEALQPEASTGSRGRRSSGERGEGDENVIRLPADDAEANRIYNELPSGAEFIDPQGARRRKP